MPPLAALPILLVTLLHAGPSSQDASVQRACTATTDSITKVVMHAATTPTNVISASLRVVVPGTLTGRIAFNPSGSTIGVAGDPSGSAGFGCATGAIGPGVPKGRGHSRLVSTLRSTFTRPGRYRLTFELNSAGRRILARLGARQRAYDRHHPHHGQPPSIAFGVSLSYSP